MLIDLAKTLGLMGRTAAWTAVRRATRGPARPGWDWLSESTLRFIKAEFESGPLDPVALRRHIDSVALPPLLRHRVRCRDVSVAGMKGRWYEPKDRCTGAVLLYIHGGGYVFGSLASHADLVVRLALASGARTLAFEYRLAPEHPYPAALDDCLAAYNWLLSHPDVDPARVVVAGESAGGGLVFTTLAGLRDESAPLPAAAVALSPWCDLSLSSASIDANSPCDFSNRGQAERWGGWYLAGADPRRPDISPMFADLSGLPPLLVQVGGAEMLHDEVVATAHRAEEAGVDVTLEVWDDMFHIWHMAALLLRQGADAIDHIGRFVRLHTGG